MKRWSGVLAVCLTFLCCLFWPRVARAANARQVVVGELEGERAEAIREAILVGLAGRKEIRLVSLSHSKKLAQKSGADLGDADGIKTVSGRLGLAAFLDGTVKSGKKWTATVRVHSGADGEVSESVRFSASSDKALISKIKKTAWQQLGPALEDVKPAKAGAGGHEIAVGPFQGPKAGTVRGYIVSALKKGKGINVISDATLKDSGIKLTKKSTDEDYAGLAGAVGATVVLDGTVTTKGKAVSVEIQVRNGTDGSVVDSVTLDAGWLPGLRQTINKQLVADLEDPLSKTASSEAPEEELPEGAGAAEEEEEEEEEGAGEGAGEEEEEEPEEPSGRPSPLEIGAGIRGFSRNYRYSDDLFDSLRSYKLGVAPAAFIYGRWYPLAHVQGGTLAHVGLTGGYERGFAVSSQTPQGEELSTTTHEWWVGLRYRVPLDAHEIGIQGTYGKHTYAIDDNPADPLVPDVAYTYLRLGLDARVRVTRVVLGAHLGFRYLTDTGELGTDLWFPHISGNAIDAGLLAGYEILDGVDLLVGFDFRRYFFSMNSEPGDGSIAGGALDEYLSGWGGFAFRLPGDAKASGGATSVSTEAGAGGE